MRNNNNRPLKAFGIATALVTALQTIGCASPSSDRDVSSDDASQPQSFMVKEGNVGVTFRSNGRSIVAQAVRNNGEHWEPIKRLRKEYNCSGEDYRVEVTKDVADAAPFSSKARKVAKVLAKKNLPSPEWVCGK